MGNCLPCAPKPESRPLKQAKLQPDAKVKPQPQAAKPERSDLADAEVKLRLSLMQQAQDILKERWEDEQVQQEDKIVADSTENSDPNSPVNGVKLQMQEIPKRSLIAHPKITEPKMGGCVVSNGKVSGSFKHVEQAFQKASENRIVSFDDLRRQRRLLKLKQKDIDNLEQEALALLDVCKTGEWDEMLQRVRANPYLVNLRPPGQQLAAIHQVICSGNCEALQELLRLKADVSVRTEDGKTALEVAQERGQTVCSEILIQSQTEIVAGPCSRRSGLVGGKMRSFNVSYARAVCIAPLIGDRHMNKELNKATMQHIADYLRSEAKRLRVSTKACSDNKGGEIDFCDLIEQASDSEMSSTLVFVHTLESFVQKEVNTAARLRQEQRTNLAPYMRGLHDVLLRGGGLERFSGTVYRVMSMDVAFAQSYRPSAVDANANLFSWDGFTSAVTTPQTAYSNFRALGANVLVIIEQDGADHPVLISKVSEFPHEEQVMYALGQSFRKRDYFTQNAGELWSDLGVVEGSGDQGEVIVIKIRPEDVFYEIAQDLFQDGDSDGDALPILKARLEFEKDRHSPWEARAYKELAGAYVRNAEYDLAMEHYQISLDQFTQRGDPRDIATINACIAHVLEKQLKYQEALDLHREVLKVHTERGDANAKAEIGRIYLSMGRIYTKRAESGDWEEALKLFVEAEKICRQYVGDVSIEVATAMNCIGEVYQRQRKLSEAVKKFEKTLQLKETILGFRHPETALVLLDLGRCYRDQDKCIPAITAFEKAVDVYERAFGPEATTVADVYMRLLPLYNSAGKMDIMTQKARFCHRVYMDHFGDEHPSTTTAKAWMDFSNSAPESEE